LAHPGVAFLTAPMAFSTPRSASRPLPGESRPFVARPKTPSGFETGRAWRLDGYPRHCFTDDQVSRRILTFVAVAALLLAGPASAVERRAVSVAAAANMKPAFEEIAKLFQARNPGVEVRSTFGASGTFFAQIANGAPFDLFLSADAEYPAKLVEEGLADGAAFPYAYGKLVVWVPGGSKLDLEGRGLAALTDPSVRKIAIANPHVAPYGRAAQSAMEKAGILEAVEAAQAAFLPRSRSRRGSGWSPPPPIPGSSRPPSS
jgi:hypothetical protein